MNGDEKLYIMRILMKERKYDAYIIPHGDQHNNEYISDSDQRIKFISGFSGSNATGLVTKSIALMWTDSRYVIQIEKELYKCWSPAKDISLEKFIMENLPPGSTIGLDLSLFSNNRFSDLMMNLQNYNFVDDEHNIIDDVWGTLKPKYSENQVMILPLKYAGMSPLEKYKLLNQRLRFELERLYENSYDENNCYRLLICKLDSIAWLLNLRGGDIPYNPVFFSYAIFYTTPDELFVHLFTNKNKFKSPEIKEHLKDNNIRLFDYDEIYDSLFEPEEYFYTVIDKSNTSFRMVHEIITRDDDIRVLDTDCVDYIKYVKNPREIEGFRRANIRDSCAVIQFLSWMEDELCNKKRKDLTEFEISLKSKEFRKRQNLFMGESFAPICGCGPNAAIVHYTQKKENNSIMSIDKIILCDTGGQYMDGTTDITRTVHYGNPTPKEKEMFTRVLLGNLSLERLIFKNGLSLLQLDEVPRVYLGIVEKSYGHSTSHGVGHFLNVHEGPRGLALEEGNIITNEPGYYEKDQFGIRTENELLVVKKGDNKLGFENLTFIPYERNLIDMNLISNDFKKYIDDYHKKCFEIISPMLKNDSMALDYLKRKTQPL